MRKTATLERIKKIIMLIGDKKFEDEFEKDFFSILTSNTPNLTIRPNLPSSAISCALLDNDYNYLHLEKRFSQWLNDDALDITLCEEVRENLKTKIVLSKDKLDRPLLLVYAPLSIAANWRPLSNLPIKDKTESQSSIAIAALSLAHLSDDLLFSAKALGMTNLEAKVTAALVSHGSMRQAANHARVTYNTARKALAEAMKRLSISRQTHLIRKVTELTTSTIPKQEAAERLLRDIFNLNSRDAKLALLLCEGYTRNEAASIIGISKSVAKDRFSIIFETLSISSATEIPRLIMETFAAAMLTKPDAPLIDWLDRAHNPLSLLQREDGSLIAVSDFGPQDGIPVLLCHSSMATRHPYKRLISVLRKNGFRPITVDRPGFGLTDDCEEEPNPFATGVEDISLICDELNIKKIHIITRGASFFALALNQQYPDLIGKVVAICPDILFNNTSKGHGYPNLIKTAFRKYPHRIEAVARWVGGRMTPARINSMVNMALKNAPIDLENINAPDVITDHQRSAMIFAAGNISGYIREQRAYATLDSVSGLRNAKNWTILLGNHDAINDISSIIEFWKPLLPHVQIEHISNANRFIDLSHPQLIADKLKE